ncbi:MAG: hypothetical protein EZS28_038480 [Streblomastix strix]|uniref:Uncharacterized protein n=1 Tax=Streblomastix strix TaxID=222440 RepID=A0A5J4U6S5_9EUKA|nr:MAG: hypothetical protein EZS28_038480 [Streblomastix strix]
MTLGTSQTITANKTFYNACRFISSIDGMATIIGASFVKSGADDNVVLLGAGGTKPISEFSNSVDDSNYVKKDGDVYNIQGILRKTTLDQPYPEPTDDDYITLGAVKSEFVSSIYRGSINGNLTATSFIKSGKDETSVLLAGGGDMQLSLFGGATYITNVIYDNPTYLNTQNFTFYDVLFYKIGTLHIFSVQTAPINTTSIPSVGIVIISTQYSRITNYQFSISGYQNNIISSNFENGNVKVNITTWQNTQILRISGM